MSTLIAHSTSSEISSGFLHQPSEGWSGLQVFEYCQQLKRETGVAACKSRAG